METGNGVVLLRLEDGEIQLLGQAKEFQCPRALAGWGQGLKLQASNLQAS